MGRCKLGNIAELVNKDLSRKSVTWYDIAWWSEREVELCDSLHSNVTCSRPVNLSILTSQILISNSCQKAQRASERSHENYADGDIQDANEIRERMSRSRPTIPVEVNVRRFGTITR
jgi:hypothetical protein